MVVMFIYFLVLCCQTLALRVSIHCEGCKKKVKKVLHSIEGMACFTRNWKNNFKFRFQNLQAVSNLLLFLLTKSG